MNTSITAFIVPVAIGRFLVLRQWPSIDESHQAARGLQAVASIMMAMKYVRTLIIPKI